MAYKFMATVQSFNVKTKLVKAKDGTVEDVEKCGKLVLEFNGDDVSPDALAALMTGNEITVEAGQFQF